MLSRELIKLANVSMSVPLTSTPLIAVMARAPGAIASYRFRSCKTVCKN